MILNLRNDNRVRLKNFKDNSTTPATPLNAGTVTAQLMSQDDPDGTPLVGPTTLVKETGVDGTYSAVWDKDLLSPGGTDIPEGEYILRYLASEGAIDYEEDALVEVRYRIGDVSSDSGI